MTGEPERNGGLDVIRSLAILMVLVSHATFFFPQEMVKGYELWRLELFGYYGVELFFVLSGFLIGRILLKTFLDADNSHSSQQLLWNFYLRRWYRTLPLYYMVFLLNIVLWLFMRQQEIPSVFPYIWRHLLFIQNYSLNASYFFPEAWSLAIEEWFYLLFPIGILLVCIVTWDGSD